MNKSASDKLAKIQELLDQKAKIEKELESLVMPEKVSAIPSDFSLNKEIVKIVEEEERISAKEILSRLQKKFPAYGIERQIVNGALVYLARRRKQIRNIERGIYGKNQPTTEVGSTSPVL